MTPNRYSVFLTKRAQKELDRLEKPIIGRIGPAIDALVMDPRPPGCLRIKSQPGVWRIRVGDYRVGYEIDDVKQEVTVIRIGHRSDFYS